MEAFIVFYVRQGMNGSAQFFSATKKFPDRLGGISESSQVHDKFLSHLFDSTMFKMQIILLILLLLVPTTVAFIFGDLRSFNFRSMFSNIDYMGVVDARLRLGLPMPSEKDNITVWYKKK
ncbi:hypothetical protein CRE_20491 [Caenorhabditis remanei]|uniref:Uncharacterized protein n=1 Tax=Caenorhabditis remanei TaxID=31234 RepID=E3N2V0_CAERE|nr:hypothetical protein CRE_20491 [Caenorhabditis remanei]